MRKVQLQDLVEQFKGRVGQSVLASAGLDDLTAIEHLLRSIQEQLYDENDWPHLNCDRYKALASGQRYYDFPTDMKYEEIETLYYVRSGISDELTRGIGAEQYSNYDSNLNITSSPATRWDVKDTGSGEQCEVWPIPAENDAQLMFRGRRDLKPLIANTDVTDLDGTLIVLTAAVEILYDQEQTGKAKRVEALAAARLVKLKARSKTGSQPVIIRGGATQGQARMPRVIAVR